MCVCDIVCVTHDKVSALTVCVRGAARSGEIAELLNPMDDAIPRGMYGEWNDVNHGPDTGNSYILYRTVWNFEQFCFEI